MLVDELIPDICKFRILESIVYFIRICFSVVEFNRSFRLGFNGEFVVTDPTATALMLTRTEEYLAEEDGFSLERRMTSSRGSLVETLQTTSSRSVPELVNAEAVELSAHFEIAIPDLGESRFGLGVGGATTNEAGYFAFVTLGPERTFLGLTRNDGLVDIFDIFEPPHHVCHRSRHGEVDGRMASNWLRALEGEGAHRHDRARDHSDGHRQH